jgi:hypothetical protein
VPPGNRWWWGNTAEGFKKYEGKFNRKMWYDEQDENWNRLIGFVKDKAVPLDGRDISVLEIIGYDRN